jgi:hypothetical protein
MQPELHRCRCSFWQWFVCQLCLLFFASVAPKEKNEIVIYFSASHIHAQQRQLRHAYHIVNLALNLDVSSTPFL